MSDAPTAPPFFRALLSVYAMAHVHRTDAKEKNCSVSACVVHAAVSPSGMKNIGHVAFPNSAMESPKTSWNANDVRRCDA